MHKRLNKFKILCTMSIECNVECNHNCGLVVLPTAQYGGRCGNANAVSGCAGSHTPTHRDVLSVIVSVVSSLTPISNNDVTPFPPSNNMNNKQGDRGCF